jgi:RNA polymerase sigma-70 factor (ECF subfamily)
MAERVDMVAMGAFGGTPPGRAASVTETRAAQPSAEEVFRLVYRQVHVLARGTRGADLDDLVQMAAEHAIRGLPSFAGRSQLATWTFRICYWTLRKHDRWYRRWLRRFALTDDGHLPEPSAFESGADDRALTDERGRRLTIALGQLSEKRRTVIVLHDLEGMTVDEVAEVVRAKPRAVRSRLRDARNALARILQTDPYFGPDACDRESERP